MPISLKNNLQKISFLKVKSTTMVSLVVLWFVLIGVWSTLTDRNEIHDVESIRYIEGHLFRIEECKKGSCYEFYTDKDKFRLAADYYKCINIDSLRREIMTGDTIYFGSLEETYGDDYYQLVSLVKENKEYISLDCINENIRSEKKFMPMVILIGFYIVSIILVYNLIIRLTIGIQKIKQWKNK
jgi:hypothetical protein